MKKQLICVLAAAMMLPSMTAFASGSYESETNTVKVEEADKKTVMVVKNTGEKMVKEDVVYIGQDSDGFSSGTSFALKANPTPGFYTIILGGNGSADKKTFFIGDAEKFADKVQLLELKGYEETATDGTVTKAYALDNPVDLSKVKSVVVTYGNESVCDSIHTKGTGEAKFAVKLTGIPLADKDKVEVFVSSTEISMEAIKFE